ncbi:MAG: SHOCT domain-containing protein [Candidatus Bathyarchaeia archaeon]
MNEMMDSGDRKVALIIIVLVAVAVIASICSLCITEASPERQIRRRWGLTESQVAEIKQLADKYRRGEISREEFESSILLRFRDWGIIPPPNIIIPDIEIFYTAKSVISTVNVALVIILLLLYMDIYRKTKAQFSIGLIIFSLMLLFYTLSSNPFMHMLFGFRAFGLGPFAMLPDALTFVALIMLLYLSLK